MSKTKTYSVMRDIDRSRATDQSGVKKNTVSLSHDVRPAININRIIRFLEKEFHTLDDNAERDEQLAIFASLLFNLSIRDHKIDNETAEYEKRLKEMIGMLDIQNAINENLMFKFPYSDLDGYHGEKVDDTLTLMITEHVNNKVENKTLDHYYHRSVGPSELYTYVTDSRLYAVGQLFKLYLSSDNLFGNAATRFRTMLNNKDTLDVKADWNPLTDIFKEMIRLFMKDYEEYIILVEQDEYRKSEHLRHATVFVDKKEKYKSEKIKEAQKSSPFLDINYRYVEYDNAIDVEAINKLASEWKELHKHMPKVSQDVELRFRLLGRHRANGLYNDVYKSMAIDPRDTSAFVHEFGHFIDYNLNGSLLSEQSEFLDMRHRYRDNLKETLETDDELSKDIKYYIRPVEVFARAFEIYVATNFSDKLGSLVRPLGELIEHAQYRAILNDVKLSKDLNSFIEENVFNA